MDVNETGTKSDREIAIELKRFLDLGQNERSIATLFKMTPKRVKELLKLVEDPPKVRRLDATIDSRSFNLGLTKARQIIREASMANRLLSGSDLCLIATKRIEKEMLRG